MTEKMGTDRSSEPRYYLSPKPDSFCPWCNNTVNMLATEQVDDAPAFWVCRCGFVGQIGVGPVYHHERRADDEP